jgi:hypothetical protein
MPNDGERVTDKKDDNTLMSIVQFALKQGALRYSEHALLRMDQRNISIFEIELIIKYGTHEPSLDEFDEKYHYWRYVIRNRDVDDRDLAISVDIEEDPDVIIVTVMQIDPVTAKKLAKRKS